jgi:hypothetical protein
MLTVLTLGAIALSLWSAPPVDAEQLQLAAKATMAASGFILTDVNSVTAVAPGAGAPQGARTAVVHVLYRAPDGIEESEVGPTGQTLSIIVVAGARFRSAGTNQWTELPTSPGLGTQAAHTVLSPLEAAAGATHVTRQGGSYSFVPPDVGRFLSAVLGVNPSQLSLPHLTAEVHGDFLTEERITAVLGQQRLSVDLVFSAIGSAPPVQAPPASSLVPAGPASGTGTAPAP